MIHETNEELRLNVRRKHGVLLPWQLVFSCVADVDLFRQACLCSRGPLLVHLYVAGLTRATAAPHRVYLRKEIVTILLLNRLFLQPSQIEHLC